MTASLIMYKLMLNVINTFEVLIGRISFTNARASKQAITEYCAVSLAEIYAL